MLRFEFGGKPQDAVSQIPLPCFDFLFREETWNVLWAVAILRFEGEAKRALRPARVIGIGNTREQFVVAFDELGATPDLDSPHSA